LVDPGIDLCGGLAEFLAVQLIPPGLLDDPVGLVDISVDGARSRPHGAEIGVALRHVDGAVLAGPLVGILEQVAVEGAQVGGVPRVLDEGGGGVELASTPPRGGVLAH